MMQKNYHFLCLMMGIFFISNGAIAQSINFDETWKEFLINNKISNMSTLVRPDKVHDELDYAKYLLMNTNSCFCQSEIEDAEKWMAEIQTLAPPVTKSIKGYVPKMVDLETKLKAYHSVDDIWNKFLKTKTVNLDELDDIKGAKTLCEKRTLAKYSYMTAHQHLCEGDVATSKDILENRTLRLTEKTTLRVKDVKGLGAEVSKMKSLYQDMSKLDVVWKEYLKTGVSPGFDLELPLFPCYPIPNMKALVLRGAVDVCTLGPSTLEEIKELEASSGIKLDRDLKKKIKELESGIQENTGNLKALNKAWAAFIPNNEVKGVRKYGFKFCETEPLIRAYIMEGFSNVCQNAGEMLEKIEAMRAEEMLDLEEITMVKINELDEVNQQYKYDEVEIEELWSKFVAQGNTLSGHYELAAFYCDNVHQVKAWVIQGMMNNCEQSHPYLERIDEFQETFEFNFVKEVKCRVQELRIKVWNCRYEALQKLARLEAPDTYEDRLKELMDEYGMGEEPEVCSLDE